MLIYDSSALYIEDAKTLEERLSRICQVLDALENAAIKAASGDMIEEYMMDDGQTKVKAVYRGVDGISKSIQGFEVIKQRILNKLNGRKMRLVDGSAIRNGNYV